jgi:endogenous inhibitor of DNA gyrase (YacG/DUF329 family)
LFEEVHVALQAKGEGRSQLFCSKRCRQMHDRVRDRLQEEVEKLKSCHSIGQKSRSGRRWTCSMAIQQRKWALARYTIAVSAHGSEDEDE